jgi:two-component system sensor histidine kinase YesM
MLKQDAKASATTITSRGDVEIRQLENVFNGLTERLKVSMGNEIAMRQANLHAQLDALQAQINPHFIYNTLNIISAKGMECGNEEIINICDQFAQMLRYSTNLHNATVTLQEELNHVRNYLHLVKARYEDRLSYTINVPDDAEQMLIPKLILQPLVENTIKHGYSDVSPVIHIDIQGEYVLGGLRLKIRDNGQGFSVQALQKLNTAFAQINDATTFNQEDANGHIGLANTYMRLTYYSGGKIPMKLYNDSGAVIELILPNGTEGVI